MHKIAIFLSIGLLTINAAQAKEPAKPQTVDELANTITESVARLKEITKQNELTKSKATKPATEPVLTAENTGDGITDNRADEVEKYNNLIREKVAQHWVLPVGKHGSCLFKVNLLPSGAIESVVQASCSGDKIFKRSAEKAVRQSSPLPVPEEGDLLRYFRTVTLNIHH